MDFQTITYKQKDTKNPIKLKSIGLVQRTCDLLFIRLTGVVKVWLVLWASEKLKQKTEYVKFIHGV